MNFDIFEMIGKKIPKYIKVCIISGLVTGLLTHFYMLTHKLPNWDDVNNMSQPGSGDYLGRWMLKYLHPLGSEYSIPAVHGFLMILFLTLAACFVLEIVQTKSLYAAVLVPALMVTFPSVACTMTFMFMAHTSGMAILMICAAVYLLRRYKYGWLPCSLLLIGALGIYQSYISIGIALMLMGMIVDILKGEQFKDTLKKGIICVIVLLASVVIYMALCHVIYPAIDQETYGGVGNMGQIAVTEMPRLIGRCYKRFLEYFIWKPFDFVSKTAQYANILICIALGGIFVYLLFIKKIYKDILRFILCICLMGFLPLAVAFVYFMAPEVDYSMLMLYAYVLIYVMLVALVEVCMEYWKGQKKGKKASEYVRYMVVAVTAVVLFVSCYTDYLITNQAYLRMEVTKDRVTSYYNRIIASVEAMDGFQNGDPVAFLGEFYYVDNPSPLEAESLENFGTDIFRTMSGVTLENGLLTSGVRNNVIRTYIGFEMTDLSAKEKEEIMSSEKYQSMPIYPTEGSIQQIDGIWIVKLCENNAQ